MKTSNLKLAKAETATRNESVAKKAEPQMVSLRDVDEILPVYDELTEKSFYNGYMGLRMSLAAGDEDADVEVLKRNFEKVQEIERKYGVENLPPMTDYDIGFLRGKRAALKWVLGAEWEGAGS
jgi:hypothetical protein